MAILSIFLPEGLNEFVGKQAVKASYASASDYVCNLIRQDQKRAAQAKLETLLLEGINSGEPIEVTPQFWIDCRAKLEERIRNKQSRS